ncbi:UDP-N-acetylmuramoyl-tripeptide--D-alanyl-D-alanine ligase [Segetibacter sp. 3557_3]|uniref:UDP-N-acetylmuramoyl-tripeptide--D-alanyl-D- alanine ligase n=1 Tax=Segetibacter sp. 3557_3 TaxID=2547429 RepID=UPI0014054442|nr:UDP-N-acetylmuramoyl-tripeptide--D-alanyl-D-alanine ligase [Segetibacter sp. 3557_3]
MNIEQLYRLFVQYPSVQTDSRKIAHGDLFFALSGPNFNGNQFAQQALEKGAAYAIVDEDLGSGDERIIRVPDALQTLQELAKHHRLQFNIPFIAITGSNGKTTTKELVSSVLSESYLTYTTVGNLNNHIGIPLTLLRVHSDAEMAVIEMGANHLREIAGYCKYVLPTHGIITNCGKAHLEGFGGVEGVRKGKGELFDFLRENGGTAFIYNEYDYLQEMAQGIQNVFTYGSGNAKLTGRVTANHPFLSVATSVDGAAHIETRLVGEYNLPNVLCAVAIGAFFNVPGHKIKTAIEHYTPTNSRSQLVETGSNKYILDAYNANPTSVKAAIENFATISAGNKVVMLGAMMELGEESIIEHQKIADLLVSLNPGTVVLVGGDFSQVKHPFLYFDNVMLAKSWYQGQSFENTWFLVKGSRSMQMEKILQ